MNELEKFKLHQIMSVLEGCFGKIYLTTTEILGNVSESDIDFYYSQFCRLGIIKIKAGE